MTKWIVVGVVVLAAACLTDRASAQQTTVPPPQPTIVPADTVTYVPVVTRRGVFGKRQVISYQPVYQPTTGVPVVTGRGRVTSVAYPPVVQQPIIPASGIGTPVTGIQQAQAIEPAPVVGTQTGPVIVQNAPVYYQVRRGLFGRMRVRGRLLIGTS